MKEKSLDRLRKSIVTFELDRESRRWNYYCDFRETSNCEEIRLTEEKKKKSPPINGGIVRQMRFLQRRGFI